MQFDLNCVLDGEKAYYVYKLAIANIQSSVCVHSVNFSGYENRKDKKHFEKVAEEFYTGKFLFYYIIYSAIKSEELYIRDLLMSNTKEHNKREIKNFFDDPARWIVSDIKHIKNLVEMDLLVQLNSDIMQLKIKPMSYAWITKEYQVDFIRSNNIFIETFKRKIQIMRDFLTLNTVAENLIREQAAQIGV